tara:strand:- start:1234 stop:1488 length:255 start_codon:yes stop_codon:yes gene_type:complete
MKPTYLEWHDAHTNAGWFTLPEAKEWAQCEWIIKECGWIVEETKEYIIFATSWKPEDEWSEEKFCSLHKIPKTWVRKRKLLATQ